jgi:segregation and condensation protein A
MAYTVKLNKFEGPLDLLLFLIKKNEVDIYDIPITTITAQYLEYLDIIQSLDLEIASDFILMAATLMRIKAQMLLPQPELEEEFEDPRKEIVERLIEYKKYKELAKGLAEMEDNQRHFFPRTFFYLEDNGFEDSVLHASNVSLFDLIAVFKEVIERASHKSYHNVAEVEISIDEQITYLLDQLALKGEALFIDLISDFKNRVVIIATFLAILELIRRGLIIVRQSSPFGEIWIYKV